MDAPGMKESRVCLLATGGGPFVVMTKLGKVGRAACVCNCALFDPSRLDGDPALATVALAVFTPAPMSSSANESRDDKDGKGCCATVGFAARSLAKLVITDFASCSCPKV